MAAVDAQRARPGERASLYAWTGVLLAVGVVAEGLLLGDNQRRPAAPQQPALRT